MRPLSRSAPAPVTDAKKSGAAFHTGVILLISTSHFIHDVYTSFLSPLLPLLIDKHSLSLTLAGLLSTVMQIPALANPFIGLWADRINARWFLIVAPTMTAIPMSLIGLAPNFTVLLILMFVTGISVSLFHVPAPVLVARLSGVHKGRGMSLFMTGGEFARAVGPVAAVAAVSLMGFDGFYPVMVFGPACSLWLYICLKTTPTHPAHSGFASPKSAWAGMWRLMLPLMAILASRGFMHALVVTFLPTYIAGPSDRLWLGGAALSVVEGAGVAGILAAGPLSDAFGRRRVLLISLVGAPIALLSFIHLEGWMRFVALGATGFTLLSTTPVMLAMVQEHCTTSPSAANGLFLMSSFTARSMITVFVGFLADMAGLRATFLISALLGCLGVPFLFMLPASKRRS